MPRGDAASPPCSRAFSAVGSVSSLGSSWIAPHITLVSRAFFPFALRRAETSPRLLVRACWRRSIRSFSLQPFDRCGRHACDSARRFLDRLPASVLVPLSSLRMSPFRLGFRAVFVRSDVELGREASVHACNLACTAMYGCHAQLAK